MTFSMHKEGDRSQRSYGAENHLEILRFSFVIQIFFLLLFYTAYKMEHT